MTAETDLQHASRAHLERMSARERVWYERLCRRLGCNPMTGPLPHRGAGLAHELLRALAGPREDRERILKLGRSLEERTRRAEDGHAARLGLPPRP